MLWIKRLFDSNFHQWKVMSLYLVRWYLSKNFKFPSNLEVSRYVLRTLSKFYQGLFFRWSKYLCSPATLPSTVACQFIQFKKHIKIDKKIICFNSLSNNNLNFVGQPFDFDGSIKSQWECLKDQFRLKNNIQFQCWQNMHGIPELWKDNIKNFARNVSKLSIQDHNLIKCHRILNLKNLSTRELYKIQLSLKYEKLITRTY